MEDKERIGAKPLNNKSHPRDRANILSILFFCWALPFFFKGLKKTIAEDDLYGPLKAHKSKILGDKLEKAWNEEINNYNGKPSLWRALTKVFGKETALFGVIVLVQELVVKMAQPIVIGKFLSYYIPHQTTMSKKEAYLYGCLIVLVSFINVLIVHSNMLGVMHLGMKLRVACCSLIYRKALKLSKNAMVQTTVGQMVNLLSNDVNRFDNTMLHIHHIWVGPLTTIVIVYLLYTTVHPAALAGVIALIVFMPLQVYMGKKTGQFRLKTALKTDQRIRLMNEIVSGIQVIKMYTWEKPFAKLIEMARKLEMKEIRAASYIRAINSSFLNYLNRTAIYCCVIAYVLTGNTLQAQYVFVVTSYYGILRQALTIWFPRGISCLAEAHISVGRIEKFLSYDEIKTNSVDLLKIDCKLTNGISSPNHCESNDDNFGIKMHDVSVKWCSNFDCTLKNIDFNVGKDQLVAIVGPVGSGKTTLLHVILQELPLINGTLDVNGTISYASQEPWLFPGSIKQNILFGQEMNQKKYDEVLKVCALQRDFSLFLYGDRTLIGERGVMLSGGQKARINLARAIYKNADIYLLDDPLSAVDTHVGRHLFDECISGYLKNKCVVLVTHQLQYLRTVDKIYLLENGSITISGNYLELQNHGDEFIRLLQSQPSITEEEETGSLKKSKLNNSEKVELPTEIKEQRNVGNVSKLVYKKYVRAGGNILSFILVITLFILAQLFGIAADYFVTFWVNIEQKRLEKIENDSLPTQNITEFGQSINNFLTSDNCIYIYTCIILSVIILTMSRSLSLFRFCIIASKNLHNIMFSKIVFTPMRFFHTNPSGRILNRFSKDMGAIDEALPITIVDTLHVGLTTISITAIVATVNPWILIPTVIILGILYVYRIIFLATSRNLKRIEGTSRSPVFTHLTASLQGLTTIRAFDAQKILRSEFDTHQDLHSSALYMFMACNRAFGFWLDINCVIYIALVTLGFLFIGTETYGGNVGLAITQSITLTGMLQWGIRQWSDLENQMTSVERIIEYTEMTPEIDNGVQKPSSYWPYSGSIEFQNICMRYSTDAPLVLNKLNFKIKGEEKIGIVGRTGAGKSSLISALFRLAEIEGSIIIDDFNIKEVPLKELRSKISIIPQDPVLFSGTLRKNLDPFEEYEDGILWNALEEVELKNLISDMPTGLQCNVSESGTNFSVGQRQLLCLARAIIRNNKILVLDEATANVDPQTDELIQATIRRKFSECTVLTIAHRLNTVMDCDRILVMDAGCVAEFDHPYKLLQNLDGVLYSLVKQTGRGMSENLIKIAEENYEQRIKVE